MRVYIYIYIYIYMYVWIQMNKYVFPSKLNLFYYDLLWFSHRELKICFCRQNYIYIYIYITLGRMPKCTEP
jgi:hypothetical protein